MHLGSRMHKPREVVICMCRRTLWCPIGEMEARWSKIRHALLCKCNAFQRYFGGTITMHMGV